MRGDQERQLGTSQYKLRVCAEAIYGWYIRVCARVRAVVCVHVCVQWDEACVWRGVGAGAGTLIRGRGFVPWATRAGTWVCSRSASRWMCSAVCVGFRDGARGDWRVGKTRSRERAIVFQTLESYLNLF